MAAPHFAPGYIPTPDPLAIPTLPANPTPLDRGKNLYYYHCMPCHGDTGQGLTDEFRMVWEEDHRNCWARGCHGGRVTDEGFPIPRYIPALHGKGAMILNTSFEGLIAYLQLTHPPQRPGVLEKKEYEDLGVFLFNMNNLPPPAGFDTPLPSLEIETPEAWTVIGFLLAALLVSGLLIRQRQE